ncbi:N-acetyltransferase [Sabulilitoribacter multivorans]|uniref:N-acetyltransferase n=1 Tax=Flaviramulus multivorans TaxID=1304750 RepID=A0ABS9IH24_9FLAO|nr:GNAT family N-acetyltransferase [Flaviramulus multivorans]MCF7560068.1 N-acetyltransferase [Flaviramulus multivorans]
MNIKHNQGENKGSFYVEVDDMILAQMTYTVANSDKIIIDHTEVDPSLKGQGVGYKLVESSVEFARTNNLKILPLCPFANAVFKKKSDYSDVLF